MNCHRPDLKPWLCALLLAGTAWPAVAQSSMVFSKPADLPIDKANAFMSDQQKDLSSFGSSAPLLGGAKTDFDILPGAQTLTPPSPGQVQQWEKMVDDEKNWTLLTPEQIMGIPTPEQIMNLPDPNHEENLTAEERYINRQERERNFSATNGMRPADSSWGQEDNPFRQHDADLQTFQEDGRPGMASRNLSRQPMNGASAFLPDTAGTDPGQNSDSIWQSAFNRTPPPPKPDPEQVAEMERFRALMDSPPPATPAPVSGYSAPPAAVPDPNMEPMPEDFNPAGHSYTRVEDSAGRPTGINPLPTITGQTPENQKAPKPKPLVKLPPWLSNEPQQGVPMQRQF